MTHNYSRCQVWHMNHHPLEVPCQRQLQNPFIWASAIGASKDRIRVSLSPDTWSTDRTWVHKHHNMIFSSYQDHWKQDSLFLDQNTAYQNDHQ
jgi:hypothetical protein